jgi:peptide deformylase
VTGDSTFSELGASNQRRLRDQGVLSCDITERVTAPRALNSRAERLIRTTTGKQLQVSVPYGLRSPCFKLTLPQQRVVASLVVSDIEALAARVGPGHPAKGIGIAANQSATLLTTITQIAEGKVNKQPSLGTSQRRASVEDGGVPAFFRYQDPDGNIIRIFNPSDATPRNPDGSYAAETDVRPEGCLSSIELRGQVARPITMVVDGEDFEGKVFRITALGPAARLLGHEVSHVNRGIEGLCIVESGLLVLTLDEYEKLEPEVIDWSYPIEFRNVPYLELTDPTGHLDASHLQARLTDQGLFTPAGMPTPTGSTAEP